MLTVGHCLISVVVKQQDDDKVIVIDQDGTSNLECCIYGKCLCSNISLALEHLQDDTEIRIQSDISLHNIVVFGNVSNVKLVGDSNPTVRCDHQGGLVGNNINYIVIQGITWDSCNGITMLSFTDVHIVECAFLSSIHLALTLHGLGSVNINGSTFSHNNGSIDVLASFVNIYGSNFYGDRKTAILVNTMNNTLAHNILSNVTIEHCGFIDISEYCVYCIGSDSLLQNLLILSTNFTNNTNTAVNIEQCNVTLNNTTFYNNVNVNSRYVNDGGAVRVYTGTVNIIGGKVLFSYNRVGSNGGAIYLNHSVMFASQGSLLFHNNTADNGGAIYIGQGSSLSTLPNEINLEFSDNHATSNGGDVYVDLHHINDAAISIQLSSYYELLTGTVCTCDFSDTAIMCNRAYINTHSSISNFTNLSSSPSCSIDQYSNNSTVFINDTIDIYKNNYTLKFLTHDLYFSTDCDSDVTNPDVVSFQCCNDETMYNCTIYNQTSGCVMTGKSAAAVIRCIDSNSIPCEIVDGSASYQVYVTVQRFGHICDDIAHMYIDPEVCWPVCPPHGSSSSQNCWPQTILPGYWYDNAFTRFVTSCPTGHCNITFHLETLLYDQSAIFPDRDLQCNAYWGGLACGECNYSAGYAIKYDTTECVPVDECLTTSVTYSLLILFGVSLLYWIVVISFIFVLLHFRFDVTAGYAYGLLFYYSVLEQLVNDVTNQLAIGLESSYDSDLYDFYDDDVDGDYDFMRLNALPFLSSIGNLKPPFTGFMNLCLGDAEMIDHLMLEYIHPLIVILLVIIIYVLARNFVLVARSIGRYVNSKSICILLLLSYSSITYTSMQLLKPLPVFHGYRMNSEMRVYWSPNIKYFHDRHIPYGIIALLCELIIGIGLPLVLVFQKYLIHYCNIHFTSMMHVTDQLMGCYKEDYRWFAAYYLICRQVLYGVNNLIDYCLGLWTINTAIFATPFPKFTIIIIICILIMVIHAIFQPYKRKGLNILDTLFLLSLVGLLLSGLEIFWNRTTSAIFWFLPLLILINYLAYFTKLKYLIIPCTCIAIFGTTFYSAAYPSFHGKHFVFGVFSVIFLASSSVAFITYIMYVLKCLYTRYCRGRSRYLAINEQNDKVDNDDDNN